MGAITAHDRIMIDALAKVSFGRFNQKQRFYAEVCSNGVKTERQRWYLTKLVQLHRRQVTNQSALQLADRWLKENAHLEPPIRSDAPATAPAAAPIAPAPALDPTLF